MESHANCLDNTWGTSKIMVTIIAPFTGIVIERTLKMRTQSSQLYLVEWQLADDDNDC